MTDSTDERPATASADETAIRERLEGWAHAVRTHHLAGVLAHHSKNIVYFDVPPPARVEGIRGYEESWPAFFKYIGRTGQFDLDGLDVVAGADVAFAHAILLVRGEHEARATSVRLTVGLRKIGEEWTIVHEHHSAPSE